MLLFFPSPFPTVALSLSRFQMYSSLCRFELHSASLYSLSLCRVDLRLLLYRSLPTPHSLSLCHFHLRLLLFRFLFVAFISDCRSFALSLSNTFVSLSLSPPTVALSISRFQMYSSVCRFHLRLLLFHFLFVASDCTAALEQEFVGMHAASWLPLLFCISTGLNGLF
jgi:hypothetical protein